MECKTIKLNTKLSIYSSNAKAMIFFGWIGDMAKYTEDINKI